MKLVGDSRMLFATGRFNATNFMNDLLAGDPFVWCILGAVLFFSGLQIYTKLRGFAKSDWNT